MTTYCFDTDVLSAVLRRDPPLALKLTERVSGLLESAVLIVPFDRRAAELDGELRAELESQGRRLDEPDLRIAAIARSRGLTLVTGNVRHFERVPELIVEDWLSAAPA